MNCQRCRFEIEDVGAGERLSAEARAHLSSCEACRAFHDERQSLKKLIGTLGPVSAPPDFDFRLRARLAAAKTAGNHRSPWRSFIASAPAIGLAAAFALVVAGVLIYKQMKSGPATPNQQETLATKSPERVIPEPAIKETVVNPSDATDAGKNQPRVAVTVKPDEGVLVATQASKPQRQRAVDGTPHGVRHESPRSGTDAQLLPSNEMAVTGAQQILPKNSAPLDTGMNQVVELPIRSASHPMRIFVDDNGGAKRRVTLAPVTFGSQDFAGMDNSRIASSQGIW